MKVLSDELKTGAVVSDAGVGSSFEVTSKVASDFFDEFDELPTPLASTSTL